MKNLTIKNKLILISLLTTGIVLILAIAALITNKFVTLRNSLVNELVVQAKIIGNNCTAALSFDDPQAAEEALNALKFAPNVVYAAIYTNDGEVFAELPHKDVKNGYTPPAPKKDCYQIGLHHLEVFQSIVLDEDTIGTIYIQSNLDKIFGPMMWYACIAGIVIVISLTMAYLMLSRLQHTITKPILLLRQATNKIAQGDLTARAELVSNDEIGDLAASFNKMTENLQETMVSKDYVDNIIKSMADTLIVVTPEATIQTVNHATCDLFGYTKEELIGKPVKMVFAEEEPFNLTLYNDLIKQNSIQNVEKTYVSKDGRKIPVIFSGTVMRRGDGEMQGLVFVALDITARKQSEEQLHKLSQAIEHSPVSVFITDATGKIEYVNPKFIQVSGYSREEVIGQNPRILKSGKTPPEEYKSLWDTINSGREWRGELQNKKKNGEYFWESISISPIKSPKGDITHFIAVKEDITEQKTAEVQLLYMAHNDPLTNLFNRRHFRNELDNWVAQAQRYGISGALLFLDMDNFKTVNDTLGHQVGDELLIAFAGLLKGRLRETDILARMGGDEFAILLPYTDAEQALSISTQILELVHDDTIKDKIHPLEVSFSIGIALFPKHGTDTETLLTNADLAMYRAKDEGRNRACVYSPDMKKQLESRLDWEKRIREAMENNQLLLHLQPIMDIKKNKIAGYEVLLRMVGEKGEHIVPSKFLNIADRFGLIQDIDRWVVHNTILLLAEQKLADKGIWFVINLSAKAFTDTALLPLIKHRIDSTSINPANIIFDITESDIIDNMVVAQQFLAELKATGCGIALDDFGIGFSSFSYLKHLPVDYLKIDGSYIRDLTQNPMDQHLVKAIVEVAQGLKKHTIAKFVGSEQTLQLLREVGVHYAQGFHIGQPSDVSEIFQRG